MTTRVTRRRTRTRAPMRSRTIHPSPEVLMPVFECTTAEHEATITKAQAMVEDWVNLSPGGPPHLVVVRSPLRSTIVSDDDPVQGAAAVDAVASEMIRLGVADSRGIVDVSYLTGERQQVIPPTRVRIEE